MTAATKADIDRIHERLDDINKTVNGIAAVCPICKEKMEGLSRTVDGFNGNAGLRAQVAAVKKELDTEIAKRKQERRDGFTRREKWMGLVFVFIMSVVSAIVGWLTGREVQVPKPPQTSQMTVAPPELTASATVRAGRD
jgi:hypothetical protein